MEVKAYQQKKLMLYLLGYLLDKFFRDNDMYSLERYGLPQSNILFNDFVLKPNRLICEELSFTVTLEKAQL